LINPPHLAARRANDLIERTGWLDDGTVLDRDRRIAASIRSRIGSLPLEAETGHNRQPEILR